MDTIFQPIDQATLMALLRANKPQRVVAYAQKSGWNLVLRSGEFEWALTNSDGATRIFPTLNELGVYLRGMAVADFSVDLGALDPSSGDADVQQRLWEVNAAAEQAESMRRQIQQALDDPGPFIPNAVAKARAAERRAELLAKAEARKPKRGRFLWWT